MPASAQAIASRCSHGPADEALGPLPVVDGPPPARAALPGRREPGDDELVFANPHTGGPLDKAAILRRLRKALKAARLDETHRFHDLRHTFGTRMAAAGVPMRTLQEWMGHRDNLHNQRYADYAPSAHEAAMVAAAFGAATPAGITGAEA